MIDGDFNSSHVRAFGISLSIRIDDQGFTIPLLTELNVDNLVFIQVDLLNNIFISNETADQCVVAFLQRNAVEAIYVGCGSCLKLFYFYDGPNYGFTCDGVSNFTTDGEFFFFLRESC